MTVAAHLQSITRLLRDRGIESPGLNAEYIVCHALRLRRIDLTLSGSHTVDPDELQAIGRMTEDRARFRPLPYVLGSVEFMTLQLTVDERALVPRPETEILVEEVLRRLRDHASPLIADIGTGSGAIALSLAHYLPAARLVATDIAGDALSLARENASRLGLSGIDFRHGDLLEALMRPAEPEGFNAICCNLPYVPSGVIDSLQPEVSRFEPRVALDGGPDGLALYATIARMAAGFLAPGGFVACEMGAGQAEAMRSLFSGRDWDLLETVRDYGDIERVLIAYRSRSFEPLMNTDRR